MASESPFQNAVQVVNPGQAGIPRVLYRDRAKHGRCQGEHQVVMPVMQHQMAEHQRCQQRSGQQPEAGTDEK